jgi:hypothetical protein
MPNMDHVFVLPEPAAMAAAPAPMVVLPSDDNSDLNIMLWSTNGFPEIANGAASVITPARQEMRTLMESFPSAPSVARLRELGVRSVVVVPERLGGTPYQAAATGPIDGLGITREQIGPDLLYRLG